MGRHRTIRLEQALKQQLKLCAQTAWVNSTPFRRHSCRSVHNAATMALINAGETTHFTINYDGTVGAPALAVANAVLATCEADLLKLSEFLPFARGAGRDPFLDPKIEVRILNDQVNGPGFNTAANFGFNIGQQCLIIINPFSANAVRISDDSAGFLFVLEMSELLMGFYGWDAGTSQGEALSHVSGDITHPASANNVVDQWLSWPRPRPDWISRNEGPAGAFTVRGDLDPIAYGCGAIFIYFLRDQLGHSMQEICGAGGTTLLDRYRNLTRATDDPATRVGDLLDAHFGTGAINIIGNNPFPLYAGAARTVLLAFSGPTAKGHALPVPGRTAHVKPFFTCAAADYPYTETGWTVTESITATTVGIGLATFTWRINGHAFFGSANSVTIDSPVAVPDANNPGHPQQQTQPFTFDYSIINQPGPGGGSSTLTITSHTFAGDYNLEISVGADELAAPTTPVTATQGLTLTTRSIRYGDTCTTPTGRFAKRLSRRVSQANFTWWSIRSPSYTTCPIRPPTTSARP